MANFGLYEKPYIKLGTSSDICYCCHKEICENERRDAYDVAHELRGSLDNQFVFYIRKSGQDTCICFDCLKKIADELTSNTTEEITTNTEEVLEVKETVETEIKEEAKEVKKASNKKTSK